MHQELEGINPAKVIMHSAFDTALSLMRTEPIQQLSYLLGQFDAYQMMSETLGILNADELSVLRQRREAIWAERTLDS